MGPPLPDPSSQPSRVSVLVCRGCCCGTVRRHPDVDHDGHLARLRGALADQPRSRLWTVDCLGPCSRSNVVVVRSAGRRRWFGEMLDDESIGSLTRWLEAGAGPDVPPDLAGHEFDPDEPTPTRLVASTASVDELIQLVSRSMTFGGAWTIGIPGAVAEFEADAAPHHVATSGSTVVARTDTGAARIRITEETAAFVVEDTTTGSRRSTVLATPITGAAPIDRVTILGADTDAIDASEQHHTLIDLGLGRPGVRFAVRTADPRLIALLRSVEGRHWTDALDRIGDDIVGASPQRVVESPAGRIEVRTAIPSPGGSTPQGSHTHLLPALLELDRPDPVRGHLPHPLVPTAVYHPPADAV